MPDTRYLVDGPAEADIVLMLAHGAGAPMDSDFMVAMAKSVGARGIRVVRFEFPYMRERRHDGRRRPPNGQGVLLDAWREAVADCRGLACLAVGGKSLGGRMATMIADEVGAAAVVCLGYPFHPPGRPERPRTAHLETLATPTLILQGERDTFGRPEEVAEYALAPSITVEWLPDGDHSFKPRKRSGYTETGNIARAVERTTRFLETTIHG